MPGYPTLPNHRTAQNIVAQPSPNFLQQQRGQNNFPFGSAGLQQQQTQQPLVQHTAQTPLSHAAHQQQSGINSNLPPHLAQNATPSLGTAPSVSSASEVGLDPNDFPALGSTPANNSTTTSSTNTASYASQAGTGAQGAQGTQGVGAAGSNLLRDFTADDFPALGGQTHTQQAQQGVDGHPPGLNGFQQHADQQHRQQLLGTLTGNVQTAQSGQQQPGLLNLAQTRNVQGGFASETDKQRNYALKLNQTQNNHTATPVAWSSPNANPGAQQANAFQQGNLPNGAHQNHGQNLQQAQPQQQQAQVQHLNAPPGVPSPATFNQQQTQGAALAGAQQTPYLGNGTAAGDTAQHPSQGPGHASAVPQTPAQQVLMSPADRWGLLGLLALIKSADPDQNLLSIGTDLGTMGLDMQTPGSLYSTFITPWADSSAAHTVEPDFHLPGCYNVQPPPPTPGKVAAFSDETLFFMFYASPRDQLQEIAAQELFGRNWRFHKELRLWITKETGTTPSQKVAGGEHGTYSYWDPENWEKSRKEMTVLYADLEEKTLPTTAPGQSVQMPVVPQHQQQAQPTQRLAAFQGMGMAAM
ncbi:hypothetical protein CERSUDRAFT_71526 [Gelatoporia subvermispora B]|uniref:NOT2/NOT3/NOT5 C-terminal domain-containing protein n=1 Tax=Ceriporiopsis subvermispora (strain B) TaxID=914234 RepID=M2RME3_CERS8|nr:hypothetical protein CERSUDRAFT_71526 [Gelatoporia subvermispora B]